MKRALFGPPVPHGAPAKVGEVWTVDGKAWKVKKVKPGEITLRLVGHIEPKKRKLFNFGRLLSLIRFK